jgi:hypothetical protein
MNSDDKSKTPDVSESIPGPTVEANDALPQEARSATPDVSRIKRRENFDGSQPLDYPGHEAVAQFLAAPKQFRRFKSVTALAKHFDVSRMTVYRWAQDLDVARRVDWLSSRNRVLGDFLPRREWAGIVQAQVAAALAGDIRAAIFCLNRAWPEPSIFGTASLQDVIEGANNVEMLLEEDATSESDELGTDKKTPETVEDKDPQK